MVQKTIIDTFHLPVYWDTDIEIEKNWGWISKIDVEICKLVTFFGCTTIHKKRYINASFIHSFHKEGKSQRVITERCGSSQSAVSKHIKCKVDWKQSLQDFAGLFSDFCSLKGRILLRLVSIYSDIWGISYSFAVKIYHGQHSCNIVMTFLTLRTIVGLQTKIWGHQCHYVLK